MLRLYRDTAVLAFRRAVKAWPVAFSLPGYAAILLATGIFVQPLGMIGGVILGLMAAACLSSYLHLLSQAVIGSKLHWIDVKRGFASRFWDVVSVMFALWIISFGSSLLVRDAGPGGSAIAAMIAIAMAFFLNVTPELLSAGRVRSFALL